MGKENTAREKGKVKQNNKKGKTRKREQKEGKERKIKKVWDKDDARERGEDKDIKHERQLISFIKLSSFQSFFLPKLLRT